MKRTNNPRAIIKTPTKRKDREMLLDGLNEKQRKFCHEYVFDFNASRAYAAAYPGVTKATAGQLGHHALKNLKISKYIDEIQKDIAKLANVSRLKIANEFRKVAFTTIGDLHKTWIERKAFEELTDDEKASIAEITTKIVKKNNGTRQKPDWVDVEYVQIRLHDKQRALESLNKMLGFNEPDKVEVSNVGISLQDAALQERMKTLTDEELKVLQKITGKLNTTN